MFARKWQLNALVGIYRYRYYKDLQYVMCPIINGNEVSTKEFLNTGKSTFMTI